MQLMTDRMRRTLQIGRRVIEDVSRHHISMIAAALAYSATLALFPTMIAAISTYGLFLSPQTAANDIEAISRVLPASVADIISTQINELAQASSSGLTAGAILSIAVALWTASSGVRALMRGINIAYGVRETRRYATVRLISYGVTIAMVVGATVVMAIATVIPPLLNALDPPSAIQTAIGLLRWPLMVVVILFGLGAIYRWAPAKTPIRSRVLSPGALVGTLGLVVITQAFSTYVGRISSLNETYGALGGIIGLMLWFFLAGFVILIGAEVNDAILNPSPTPETSRRITD
jgi:membrane protein